MENYYLKERKNFSKESEKLVERIKDGYTPTDKEVLFLITSEEWQKKNKEQLDLKDELDEIRSRVACGVINEKDFNRLTEICKFDEKTKDELRKGFKDKNILKEEKVK